MIEVFHWFSKNIIPIMTLSAIIAFGTLTLVYDKIYYVKLL